MIFLSASIPDQQRDEKYYQTADVIAIRDAVRALTSVVVPHSKIIMGGHPAITPLIRYVIERMDADANDHITIYQSLFFKDKFPEDNLNFNNIVYTPSGIDQKNSLLLMRLTMIPPNSFKAGVFIGGMDGVEDEYNIFRKLNPRALLLPVASTGGAAEIIYNELSPEADKRLKTEYAYMSLFRSLLKEVLNLT